MPIVKILKSVEGIFQSYASFILDAALGMDLWFLILKYLRNKIAWKGHIYNTMCSAFMTRNVFHSSKFKKIVTQKKNYDRGTQKQIEIKDFLFTYHEKSYSPDFKQNTNYTSRFNCVISFFFFFFGGYSNVPSPIFQNYSYSEFAPHMIL